MKPLMFLVTLFITACSFGQSKDETAVRKILSIQQAAWNRGDIDGFMKGYWENDSLMFIGKSGITYGWNKTLNNYKKGYPDTSAMGKLAFTIGIFSRYWQMASSKDHWRCGGLFHLIVQKNKWPLVNRC